jgi:MFS family permease
VISTTLAALAWSGTASVGSLVLLTFLGGTGAALAMPAWQSITPELVPRADLKGAVALNSLGINISRAIGPALGGFVLAGLGAAATYGLDVLTYAVVIAALLWWRREAGADDGLREHFGGALRAGLRYAAPAANCTGSSGGRSCSSPSRARSGRSCPSWRAGSSAEAQASMG